MIQRKRKNTERMKKVKSDILSNDSISVISNQSKNKRPKKRTPRRR